MIALQPIKKARNRIVGEMLTDFAKMRQTTELRKRVLRAMARLRHGEGIQPCHDKDGLPLPWSECVTEDFGCMYLWYNDAEGSTHIQTIPIEKDISQIPPYMIFKNALCDSKI